MKALAKGLPEVVMDALVTTADTKGSSFALPWTKNNNYNLTWVSRFATAPGAVSLQLQGALNDVDAQYAVLDTSTAIAGEMKHVAGLNIRFVRVRQVSRTGADAYTTVDVMVN